MSIKDRLMAKSGDIGKPREDQNTAAVREAAASRQPKTGPGQMIAFRREMQQHNEQVAQLEAKLAAYDGALPVRKLDPNEVQPSRWANRHNDSYADDEFFQLCESMVTTGGNEVPGKVRPRAEGGFELVYGHRRHRGCLDKELPFLAIIDDTLTDQDLFVQMEHENRERKNPSPWEQGRSYRAALDAGLWASQHKLSEALGVSQGYVSNAMAVYALPAAIVGAFRSPNDIQFKWARELAALGQLEDAALQARVRAASELEDRSAKKVYAALTKGEDPAISAGSETPAVISNTVTVSVSGRDTKVLCKKVVLSIEQQQKLAELVDDWITAQRQPDPTAS